jgi:hypothetical protein
MLRGWLKMMPITLLSFAYIASLMWLVFGDHGKTLDEKVNTLPGAAWMLVFIVGTIIFMVLSRTRLGRDVWQLVTGYWRRNILGNTAYFWLSPSGSLSYSINKLRQVAPCADLLVWVVPLGGWLKDETRLRTYADGINSDWLFEGVRGWQLVHAQNHARSKWWSNMTHCRVQLRDAKGNVCEADLVEALTYLGCGQNRMGSFSSLLATSVSIEQKLSNQACLAEKLEQLVRSAIHDINRSVRFGQKSSAGFEIMTRLDQELRLLSPAYAKLPPLPPRRSHRLVPDNE